MSKFAWNEGDVTISTSSRSKLKPSRPKSLSKGDYAGHPFRGNQWTKIGGEKLKRVTDGVYETKDGYTLRQGANSKGKPSGTWSVFDESVNDFEPVYESNSPSLAVSIKEFRRNIGKD